LRKATWFVSTAVLLVACGDVRVGLKSVPVEVAQSDDAALGAIKNVLPPDQEKCSLELVKAGASTRVSESTTKQVLSVRVCGQLQEFSIQRSQTSGDKVLIVAQKI
jgi:hypothetical protein